MSKGIAICFDESKQQMRADFTEDGVVVFSQFYKESAIDSMSLDQVNWAANNIEVVGSVGTATVRYDEVNV